VDRYGDPWADDTFLVIVNRGGEIVSFMLPASDEDEEILIKGWTPVPEFQADLPDETFDVGDEIDVLPHMLVVLRAEQVTPVPNGQAS
jgi:hypothetical protein